ncbi:MAG: hypothetical protein Q8S31_07920 [Alphaproteobacteria bacterium]|nr:hypothetical protein [Alphaproteobacteria bacterium]
MKKLVSLAVLSLVVSSSGFARVSETVEDHRIDFTDINFEMLSDLKSNQKNVLNTASYDYKPMLEAEAAKTASDDVSAILKELDLYDEFEELNFSDDRQYSPLQPKLIYEDGVVKQQAGFTFARLPEISDVANLAYCWTGTNEHNVKFDSYAKQYKIDNFKVVKAVFDEKDGLNAISLLKDDILYVSYRGSVTILNDFIRADGAIVLNNLTSYIQQIIKKGGEFTPAFLNTLIGSLVDGALSKNVETAEDFLLGTIEKADTEGLKYRKLIVTGHSLGGFYAQTIAAKFPSLVNEAHSFNGPGVPAAYIPYDAPGHHIFNHVRADWTDIDPVGKFAAHQGNVIFYPTANREGMVAKLNPIHQHLMGGFGEAINAGLKPYPGAKLLTFTPTTFNPLESIINFDEAQKPVFQREVENKELYLNSLNSNVFDAFEECSTLVKGVTGHENYYFDMVSSGGVKASNAYKKDLMEFKDIMNYEYNVLMQNPTDANVAKFKRIAKELALNIADKLHQVNTQKKQEASRSMWSKAKGLFGF